MYETAVDDATAQVSYANNNIETECARQGARRVAHEVASWWRELVGIEATAPLPDSLQKLLEQVAPD